MSDHDEIRRTLAMGAQLLDDKRFVEWGALFAADARFEARGNVFDGRDAITHGVSELLGTTVTKHLLGSSVIEVNGARALAWTDLATFVGTAGAINAVSVGRYHDELERTAPGWVLRSRVLVMAGDPAPAHAAPVPALR